MLYLVIGKRKLLTLANNEPGAVAEARRLFEDNGEDPGDLRAVSKYNADEPDRSMLAFWDAVAERAMSSRTSTVKEIEEELRSLDVLLYHAVATHVASSRRMEDTERRRCANIVSRGAAQDAADAMLDELVAPLVAIAEARGMVMVDRQVLSDVPVLRWVPAESGPNHVASVGRWVLEASTGHWAVMVTYENGGVKDEVSGGTALNSREAMLAAQDELRKLGVSFRTE